VSLASRQPNSAQIHVAQVEAVRRLLWQRAEVSSTQYQDRRSDIGAFSFAGFQFTTWPGRPMPQIGREGINGEPVVFDAVARNAIQCANGGDAAREARAPQRFDGLRQRFSRGYLGARAFSPQQHLLQPSREPTLMLLVHGAVNGWVSNCIALDAYGQPAGGA
jgi:hypothetical protein